MTDLIKSFQEKIYLSSKEIREVEGHEEIWKLVDQGKVKLDSITKNSIWKWQK